MKNMPPPPKSFSFNSNLSISGTKNRAPDSYDKDQMSVIKCNDESIVVQAKAGTGKTTTSIAYAAARPEAKFLYLCFGKANQLEAAGRFGANVECRTGNSLAYGALIRVFGPQLIFKNLSSRDFAAQLNIGDIRTAAIVQDALGKFLTSADDELTVNHVLEITGKWEISPHDYDLILSHAKNAWSKMQKPGSGVSIPPDACVKIWALSSPKLKKYTHIILEEAQDTNPVMAKVVDKQTHAKKIIIGDSHQSIFLFRGAENAMETFAQSGATLFNLSHTWRFGPKIAHSANELLGFFKNEKVKIIGAGPSTPKINESKRAVLSRTNAGVYAAAAAVMGKNTHWMGGINQYRLDTLLDVFHLRIGQTSEVRSPELRRFQSWAQYKDESKLSQDNEASMLIRLVDQYGKDIPYMVRSFYANAKPTEADASLILSTIHKAKGLDFDVVQIAEDFNCTEKALAELILSPNQPLSPVMAQEINLLYVGITRAKHDLHLNTDTCDFLKNIDIHRGEVQEALGQQNSTHTSLMSCPAG